MEGSLNGDKHCDVRQAVQVEHVPPDSGTFSLADRHSQRARERSAAAARLGIVCRQAAED